MTDIVTFQKNIHFHEYFTAHTFLEQSAPLPTTLKEFLFVQQYHVKAEHPDIIRVS